MTQEEKAKRYDEALEKARKYRDEEGFTEMEDLFPELAESEDERIKKIITDSVFFQYGAGVEYKDVLDYLDKLEKQKEQKPRDYRKLYEEVVNSEWFKQNYVGKSLGEEENPKEWSEEDEKKINFLSRLIEFQVKDDEYCFGDGRLISKQEAIEMLKSLRPSWKPSEEQIGALNYAYCELFKREDVGHNILGSLQELCDELRELM